MRRAAEIVERHRDRLPLIVVSAVGTVTRALLQLGNIALQTRSSRAASGYRRCCSLPRRDRRDSMP